MRTREPKRPAAERIDEPRRSRPATPLPTASRARARARSSATSPKARRWIVAAAAAAMLLLLAVATRISSTDKLPDRYHEVELTVTGMH